MKLDSSRPTPTARVTTELTKFLRSVSPEVLCISGAWGVGKTHLWKEVLVSTANEKPPLPILTYSYVSLFGVDTLEDLRLSIFSNQISLSENMLTTAINWSRKRAKTAQPLLEQTPKIGGLFKLVGGMYFSSVRKMIICIDDLERRANTLRIEDVLGLISFLKEERNCKIVLLLNDGQLGDSTEKFRAYFEKTIDVHLILAPTAEESAAIAFQDASDVDVKVRAQCVELGIVNIRIIKKIRRTANLVQPYIKDFDPEVIDSATRSIVMLGWSLLKGTGAPPIAHLRARTGMTIFKPDTEAKLAPEEETWNKLLDDFNWRSLDELDNVLIEALEVGYFEADRLAAAATELQNRLEHQRLDGRFEDAWKPYHGSFDDNADQVMDAIYDAFRTTYKTISFINLDGTIRLFKDLGRPTQATELLKLYTDNRTDLQSFWDLEQYAFSGDVRDPEVKQAIADKLKSFGKEKVSMGGLLEAMGGTSKGWNMQDVSAIAALPVEEYVKLFKFERGDRLRRIVNGGLLARRSGNPTESMKTVTQLTTEALREIAEESPLNARRIGALYNIDFTVKHRSEDNSSGESA